MARKISNLSFEEVGLLRLKRAVDGSPAAYGHQLRPEIRANRYAAGPFCDFGLPEATARAGVYALGVGEEIKYIGECDSLESRFGPGGYGHVSARNCHFDGQSTNCKINSLVLSVCLSADQVRVWFLATAEARKSVESRLIRELSPPWNGRMPLGSRVGTPSSLRPGPHANARGSDQFVAGLRELFAEAQHSGQRAVRVRAGDLHRRVGGYPGPSHRMPQCCAAMRAAMAELDVVILAPPKGAGASLVIEYRLPRPDSLSTIALEPTSPVKR